METMAMHSRNNIKLYDIFRKDLRLPDEKAQELVETIEDVVNEGHELAAGQVATKEFVKDEIKIVKDEIYATREFLKNEIHATREFVKDEVNNLKNSILIVDHKIDHTAAQLKNELTDSINRAFNRSTLIQVLAFVGAIMGVIGFILKK